MPTHDRVPAAGSVTWGPPEDPTNKDGWNTIYTCFDHMGPLTVYVVSQGWLTEFLPHPADIGGRWCGVCANAGTPGTEPSDWEVGLTNFGVTAHA